MNDRDEKKLIYLDHAATTPVKPEVVEAMMPYLTRYYGKSVVGSTDFLMSPSGRSPTPGR